jgi:hypothetical protein
VVPALIALLRGTQRGFLEKTLEHGVEPVCIVDEKAMAGIFEYFRL